jgi:hypothetical protein
MRGEDKHDARAQRSQIICVWWIARVQCGDLNVADVGSPRSRYGRGVWFLTNTGCYFYKGVKKAAWQFAKRYIGAGTIGHFPNRSPY